MAAVDKRVNVAVAAKRASMRPGFNLGCLVRVIGCPFQIAS